MTAYEKQILPEEEQTPSSLAGDYEAADRYEHPEVTDYGSLKELTLSGNAPLSDSFGGSAGGGS